jgi:hypothetical protein
VGRLNSEFLILDFAYATVHPARTAAVRSDGADVARSTVDTWDAAADAAMDQVRNVAAAPADS